jgi:hypothetical protein
MTSITKTDKVDDNGEIKYFYYELPDTSSVSNYLNHAKPLLEEVQKIFEDLKKQSEDSYTKQEEMDKNYQREIAELKQKTQELESEISDITNQAKQQFRELFNTLTATTSTTSFKSERAKELAELFTTAMNKLNGPMQRSPSVSVITDKHSRSSNHQNKNEYHIANFSRQA